MQDGLLYKYMNVFNIISTNGALHDLIRYRRQVRELDPSNAASTLEEEEVLSVWMAETTPVLYSPTI
jgi:hypothetical protein